MAEISKFTDLSGTTHTIKDAVARSNIDAFMKATLLANGDDLNDCFKTASPQTDASVHKWVIPSAAVGASLKHLPADFKTAYPNAIIEWQSVKTNGVGYQKLIGGTATSFQVFMRFRHGGNWGEWVTVVT